MTWSSASASATAVVALALLGACTADRVVDTQAVVIAQTDMCDALALSRRLVNDYRVLVFEFTSASDPEVPPCIDCVRTGRCRLVRQQCLCGRPAIPSTIPLNNALEDFRIEDLDPGYSYCLAVVAYDQVPPRACACDRLEAMSSLVCGISLFPSDVGENATAIIIPSECRAGCGMAIPTGL